MIFGTTLTRCQNFTRNCRTGFSRCIRCSIGSCSRGANGGAGIGFSGYRQPATLALLQLPVHCAFAWGVLLLRLCQCAGLLQTSSSPCVCLFCPSPVPLSLRGTSSTSPFSVGQAGVLLLVFLVVPRPCVTCELRLFFFPESVMDSVSYGVTQTLHAGI